MSASLPQPRVEITSDTYTVRWLSDTGAQVAMITWRRSGSTPVFSVGYVTGRGHGAEVYDVGVAELARYVGPGLLIGCDQGVSLRAARRWDAMVSEGSASWTMERAGRRHPARLAFGPGPVGSGGHDWWHLERARRVAEGSLADEAVRPMYRTEWAASLYRVVLR